jgi:hypothetical protein
MSSCKNWLYTFVEWQIISVYEEILCMKIKDRRSNNRKDDKIGLEEKRNKILNKIPTFGK